MKRTYQNDYVLTCKRCGRTIATGKYWALSRKGKTADCEGKIVELTAQEADAMLNAVSGRKEGESEC